MAVKKYMALNNIKYQAGEKDKDGKADTRQAEAGEEFTVEEKFAKPLLDKGRIELVKAAK